MWLGRAVASFFFCQSGARPVDAGRGARVPPNTPRARRAPTHWHQMRRGVRVASAVFSRISSQGQDR